MALFDKLFGKQKTVSQLTIAELRKEEILRSKRSEKLQLKVRQISQDKRKIFETGSKERTPELRKVLAQQFEMKTVEQNMVLRQVNVLQRELLIISRVKMLKENSTTATGKGSGRLNITEADFAKIGGMIDQDVVGEEMYMEKLDDLNELGASGDADILAQSKLGSAGSELMAAWEAADAGELDVTAAFGQADDAVRKRLEAGQKQA